MAAPAAVREVIVAGEPVGRDGHLTRIDAEHLRRDAAGFA